MDLAFKELEEFFFDEHHNGPPNPQCGHVNHPKLGFQPDFGQGSEVGCHPKHGSVGGPVCATNNTVSTLNNSTTFNEIWDTFCQDPPVHPKNLDRIPQRSADPQIHSPFHGMVPGDNGHQQQNNHSSIMYNGIGDRPPNAPTDGAKYQTTMHLPDSPPDSGSEPYSPPQDLGLRSLEDPRAIHYRINPLPIPNATIPQCHSTWTDPEGRISSDQRQNAWNSEPCPLEQTRQKCARTMPQSDKGDMGRYYNPVVSELPNNADSANLKSLLGAPNAHHLLIDVPSSISVPNWDSGPAKLSSSDNFYIDSQRYFVPSRGTGTEGGAGAGTVRKVSPKIYPLLNDQLDGQATSYDGTYAEVDRVLSNNGLRCGVEKNPEDTSAQIDNYSKPTCNDGKGVTHSTKKRKLEERKLQSSENRMAERKNRNGNPRINQATSVTSNRSCPQNPLEIITNPLVHNICIETTPLKSSPAKSHKEPHVSGIPAPKSSQSTAVNKNCNQFSNTTISTGCGGPMVSSLITNQLSDTNSYQCIQWHPFQPSAWCSLYASDFTPLMSPSFTVVADKGFNFSSVDESFVCQKKNHFQVTLDMCLHGDPKYIKALDGSFKPIENFVALFYGIKAESTSQIIRIEQSQSDRSKRSFQPVQLPLVPGKPFKWTIGRLHFSETTTNNMRKKGKPNPDQRYFMLVVALGARIRRHDNGTGISNKIFCFPPNFYEHSSHANHLPVRAPIGTDTEDFGTAGDTMDSHVIVDNLEAVGNFDDVIMVGFASEKIIVRASNPGQFDNDPEFTWQRGQKMDSICHMGQVGINTDNPDESLVVNGNIKLTGHILQPSDTRIKTNITELDSKQQLRNVSKIKVYHYRYDPSKVGFPMREGDTMSDTGVLAQEIAKVIPEAVKKTAGYQMPNGEVIQDFMIVNKERIFMENVGAVKELTKLTGTLGSRIEKLERLNKAIVPKCHRSNSFRSISNLSNSMSYTSSIMIHSTSSKVSSSSITPSRSISTDIYQKFGTLRPENSRTFKSACKKLLRNKFLQCSCAFITIIMGFCLVTMSTLFVLEYMHRHNRSNESRLNHLERAALMSDPEEQHPRYNEPLDTHTKGSDRSFLGIPKTYPESGTYRVSKNFKTTNNYRETFTDTHTATSTRRENYGINYGVSSTKKLIPNFTRVPSFSISFGNRTFKIGTTSTHLPTPQDLSVTKSFAPKNQFPKFNKVSTFPSTTLTLAPYLTLRSRDRTGSVGESLSKDLKLDISGEMLFDEMGLMTGYPYRLTPLPIPIHISACFKRHHAVCPTYCCDNSSATFYFRPGRVPKFLVGLSSSSVSSSVQLSSPTTMSPVNKAVGPKFHPVKTSEEWPQNHSFLKPYGQGQYDISDTTGQSISSEGDDSLYGADDSDILGREKSIITTLVKISKVSKPRDHNKTGGNPIEPKNVVGSFVNLTSTKATTPMVTMILNQSWITRDDVTVVTPDIIDSNSLNFSADDTTISMLVSEMSTHPMILLNSSSTSSETSADSAKSDLRAGHQSPTIVQSSIHVGKRTLRLKKILPKPKVTFTMLSSNGQRSLVKTVTQVDLSVGSVHRHQGTTRLESPVPEVAFPIREWYPVNHRASQRKPQDSPTSDTSYRSREHQQSHRSANSDDGGGWIQHVQLHEEDGEKWIPLSRSSLAQTLAAESSGEFASSRRKRRDLRFNGIPKVYDKRIRAHHVGWKDENKINMDLIVNGIKLLELEQNLRCALDTLDISKNNQKLNNDSDVIIESEESTLFSSECHGPADQSFSFSIPLAFPFIPITLDFDIDKDAILVLCDHYFSHMPCRQQSYLPVLADDLQESKNRWRLPVGQYFWSSYKFRVAKKNTFFKPLEICTWSDKNIGKTYSQSSLYFQRIPCHS